MKILLHYKLHSPHTFKNQLIITYSTYDSARQREKRRGNNNYIGKENVFLHTCRGHRAVLGEEDRSSAEHWRTEGGQTWLPCLIPVWFLIVTSKPNVNVSKPGNAPSFKIGKAPLIEDTSDG